MQRHRNDRWRRIRKLVLLGVARQNRHGLPKNRCTSWNTNIPGRPFDSFALKRRSRINARFRESSLVRLREVESESLQISIRVSSGPGREWSSIQPTLLTIPYLSHMALIFSRGNRRLQLSPTEISSLSALDTSSKSAKTFGLHFTKPNKGRLANLALMRDLLFNAKESKRSARNVRVQLVQRFLGGRADSVARPQAKRASGFRRQRSFL